MRRRSKSSKTDFVRFVKQVSLLDANSFKLSLLYVYLPFISLWNGPTDRFFVFDNSQCDAAVQGKNKAALLQATYTAIYEVGCLAGAIYALFYGNRKSRELHYSGFEL